MLTTLDWSLILAYLLFALVTGGGLADREYRVGLEVQYFAWRGARAAGDPALVVVADEGLDRGGGLCWGDRHSLLCALGPSPTGEGAAIENR